MKWKQDKPFAQIDDTNSTTIHTTYLKHCARGPPVTDPLRPLGRPTIVALAARLGDRNGAFESSRTSQAGAAWATAGLGLHQSGKRRIE